MRLAWNRFAATLALAVPAVGLSACSDMALEATGGLSEDGSLPEVSLVVSGGGTPTESVDSRNGGWAVVEVTAGEQLSVRATATDPGGMGRLELVADLAEVDAQLREADDAYDLNPTEADPEQPLVTVYATATFTVPTSGVDSFEVTAECEDLAGNAALPVTLHFVVHRSEAA